MSVKLEVSESCLCGGHAVLRVTESGLCVQAVCIACGRKGSFEVMQEMALRSWTDEMKRLKGKA